ncbi:MAG: AAA family ATPase, partial [Sphingopyxis sp.]|nr:AAA family ATPase [Sphingopyxis sp.]
MVLAQISLTDFRNHAATRIDAGPGMVVLSGPNGSGKTNILEAVSLLAPGRGLRGAALDTMVRQGADRGVVSAEACPPGQAQSAPVALGTAIEAGSARRKVRINGADASATALGEWLSLLWLTPAMDRLFVESASGRRRFLDRMTLALEPSHGRHASRYEAAMRARNRLLADDRPADGAWLAALEEQMAQHGAAVDAARHRLAAALAAVLEKSAPADG